MFIYQLIFWINLVNFINLTSGFRDDADICKNIIPPVNGKMVRITSSLYKYTCNKGFVLFGAPLYRSCLLSGNWVPQEEPTCEDIDECKDFPTNKSPCSPYATCTNTIGGYFCNCTKGYVGNGHRCVPKGFKEHNIISDDAKCGLVMDRKKVPKRRRVRRIVDGLESKHGDWPWLSLITVKDGTVPQFSGVLIKTNWVLTIASLLIQHDGSLVDAKTIHVSLGRNFRNKPELQAQSLRVRRILIHPKFRHMESLNHDIALLQLERDADKSDNVNTICLVNIKKSKKFEKSRARAAVAGWGLTEPVPIIADRQFNITDSLFSGVLKHIYIPIAGPHKCIKSTAYYFNRKTMICAGKQGSISAPCIGDGGSPLMVKDVLTNRWVLLGLFSWSEGCGQPNKYSYYTRVSKYKKWIIDETNMKTS